MYELVPNSPFVEVGDNCDTYYADMNLLLVDGQYVVAFTESQSSLMRLYTSRTFSGLTNNWSPVDALPPEPNSILFATAASNEKELVVAYYELLQSVDDWAVKVRVSRDPPLGSLWEEPTTVASFSREGTDKAFKTVLHYLDGELYASVKVSFATRVDLGEWIFVFEVKLPSLQSMVSTSTNGSHWTTPQPLDFSGQTGPHTVMGMGTTASNQTYILATTQHPPAQAQIFEIGSSEVEWKLVPFANLDPFSSVDPFLRKMSSLHEVNGVVYAAWVRNNNELIVAIGNESGTWNAPRTVYTASRQCIMLPAFVYDGIRIVLYWSEREFNADCTNEDFSLGFDVFRIPGQSINVEADNQIMYMVSEDAGKTWLNVAQFAYADPNQFVNNLNKAGIACDQRAQTCKMCFSTYSDDYPTINSCANKQLQVLCVDLHLQASVPTDQPTFNPTTNPANPSPPSGLSSTAAIGAVTGSIVCFIVVLTFCIKLFPDTWDYVWKSCLLSCEVKCQKKFNKLRSGSGVVAGAQDQDLNQDEGVEDAAGKAERIKPRKISDQL